MLNVEEFGGGRDDEEEAGPPHAAKCVIARPDPHFADNFLHDAVSLLRLLPTHADERGRHVLGEFRLLASGRARDDLNIHIRRGGSSSIVVLRTRWPRPSIPASFGKQ